MRLALAFAAFAFLAACSQEEAQTKLPVAKVVIDTPKGPVTFDVELAQDDASRKHGLMFRQNLAPNAGMLFDFGKPGPRAFWMKNTPLSLDMIFIRADGTISNIATNTIPYSEESVPSLEPVQAVLEINGGRSADLDIRPGEVVHAAVLGNLK